MIIYLSNIIPWFQFWTYHNYHQKGLSLLSHSPHSPDGPLNLPPDNLLLLHGDPWHILLTWWEDNLLPWSTAGVKTKSQPDIWSFLWFWGLDGTGQLGRFDLDFLDAAGGWIKQIKMFDKEISCEYLYFDTAIGRVKIMMWLWIKLCV